MSSRPSDAAIRPGQLRELDELKADLEGIAHEYPLGDVQMLILSAAEKLGMAADLMEAETNG
jgi:hypothetical protein